jgi:hypothetical protein
MMTAGRKSDSERRFCPVGDESRATGPWFDRFGAQVVASGIPVAEKAGIPREGGVPSSFNLNLAHSFIADRQNAHHKYGDGG